ncbi:hypothetical protein GCM10027343_43800 [Noviherbaspirillum agri]
MQEAKVGEALLEDIPDDDLAKEMGFRATPTLSADEDDIGNGDLAKNGKKRNMRPGQRNPSRDVVGEAAHV